MATISSVGVGSGLDAEGIITKLVTVEKAPLQQMEKKAEFTKSQISAFGQVKSQFSGLSDASAAMVNPDSWNARKASSSDESVATITAKPGASPTSFTLQVDALAKQQSVSSEPIEAGKPVGPGTLTLRLGEWGSDAQGMASFKPAPSSQDVTIKVIASDTVSSVARKINTANAGVVATVLNDGENERLLLRSKDMGAQSGFRLESEIMPDDIQPDGQDLRRMEFAPDAGAWGMSGPLAGQIEWADDAHARINGIPVTGKSNQLDSSIPGVSITLLAAGENGQSSSPITMSVSEDVTVAVKNVQGFITAYNTLVQDLAELTKYDPESKQAGPFQGDSSVVGLLNVLRTISGSTSEGSEFKRLSDVGIEMQLDGTLNMNTGKFGQAANKGTELQKLFIADNKNPQTNGFALKFRDFAKGATATGGVVSSKADALDKDLQHNMDDQKKLNDRVAMTEARLRKQYSDLDKKMGSLNALNAYVSQQVTAWNKTKD